METDLSIISTSSDLPISLLHLLSNSLVLGQTVPYLPVSSLLALGATSKSFRDLVHRTPNVFRHLDLSNVKSAQFDIANIDNGGEVWRNVQLDENVTEDDFYGGPLLYIFNTLRRRHILQDVQTLILDGLSVTSELISDIITQDHFNVRILSIREVQNLHPRKLQQALRYAVRPSRPAGTPKLKGLYFFGPKDASSMTRADRGTYHSDNALSHRGVINSRGAQIGAQWNQKSGDALAEEIIRGGDKWYSATGRVLAKAPTPDWDSTILACQGLISFDVVLCQGPRHSDLLPRGERTGHCQQNFGGLMPPRVATHSIGGCHSCGRASEGIAKFGTSSLERFPLLAPPPSHSSTTKAAKTPFVVSGSRLLLRCVDCLSNRFCESCQKWWCEDCYEIPESGHGPPHQWNTAGTTPGGHPEKNVKVHMGLCVEDCFVAEMMSGAGSNGMWG